MLVTKLNHLLNEMFYPILFFFYDTNQNMIGFQNVLSNVLSQCPVKRRLFMNPIEMSVYSSTCTKDRAVIFTQ